MRISGWLAVIFVGIVLLARQAAARDLYVNNVVGNDRLWGFRPAVATERDGPVQTIGRAIELAQASDRIVLAKTGKPYHECLALVGNRLGGTHDQPLVLDGSGAILDGTAVVPGDRWEHYRDAVFRFAPRTLGYQALFLNDRPVPQVPLTHGSVDLPKLKPLEWCLRDGCVYFCVEPNRLPRDYALSYAEKQTGITLYHVEHVVIANLIVQGFRVDGIQAANSARNIRLIGVTVRGNGRTGITVGGASLVDIDGCLVGDNSRAQLLTLALSETHVRRSDVLPLTAPAWVDQGGRFFLGSKLVQGGLEKILAEPEVKKRD